MPTFGPKSVVVPGMVGGVEELHRSFGRAEFAPLLGKAVGLAEGGFPVSRWARKGTRQDTGGASPREALLALGVDGMGPEPGDDLRQRSLAETSEGDSRGRLGGVLRRRAAEEMQAALGAGGWSVEGDDLAFSPRMGGAAGGRVSRTPQVFEIPPNSMGAAALMILKEIEGGEPPAPDSLERVTRVTEATKVALGAKDEFIGDPRFVGFDLRAFLGSRLAPRRSSVAEGDTTYFAVADGDGNLLSCIQSLFHPFGSRVYLKGSGFFLNNRASAFKLEGPNKLAPRKRPVHTLSALLLSKRRGEPPYLAMGTSGGELRPQLHALFVSNVVDYSMDVEGALGYPRFVWDGERGRRRERIQADEGSADRCPCG